jgi:hypothetical protein
VKTDHAGTIAFFETVMVKSYEALVDSDTKVEVHTGMVVRVGCSR